MNQSVLLTRVATARFRNEPNSLEIKENPQEKN